jgi:hypothetical protein
MCALTPEQRQSRFLWPTAMLHCTGKQHLTRFRPNAERCAVGAGVTTTSHQILAERGNFVRLRKIPTSHFSRQNKNDPFCAVHGRGSSILDFVQQQQETCCVLHW